MSNYELIECESAVVGEYCTNCGMHRNGIICLEHQSECNKGADGFFLLTYPPVSRDKKWDAGKPMVGQMKKDFAKALLAVAEVSTFGIEKYKKPGSWKDVENAMARYEDALGRHDLQLNFELRDSESNKLHAAHRAWNALATLQMLLEELEDEDDTVRED